MRKVIIDEKRFIQLLDDAGVAYSEDKGWFTDSDLALLRSSLGRPDNTWWDDDWDKDSGTVDLTEVPTFDVMKLEKKQKIRLLICGGRHYSQRVKGFNLLTQFKQLIWNDRAVKIVEVIEGGARGADAIGGEWADKEGIKRTTVEAEWEKHGKAAGYIRNKAMLDMRPDVCFAFPGGAGTADMVRQCRKAGVIVVLTQD